jgi:hypothetical protein
MHILLISALIVLPLIVLVLIVWRMSGSNAGTMPKPTDKSPGWHPDPIGSGERYWDGKRWTEESRP